MRNLLSRLLLSAGLFFGFAGIASADLIFDLDTGNPGISAYPSPYATVTVHWVDSTHATLTFDALTAAGGIVYYFGGAGAVGANISGAFSLGTTSCSGGFTGSCGPLSSAGSGNEDGFGTFNMRVTSFDGMTHSASEIIVGLTAISGNTWADENSVLTANAGGALAAAHIFVLDPSCTALDETGKPIGATGACTTGFAAGSNSPTPPVIPEPEGLALVGIGLVMLVASRRRKIS